MGEDREDEEIKEREAEKEAINNIKVEKMVTAVEKYQIRERSENDFFICLKRIVIAEEDIEEKGNNLQVKDKKEEDNIVGEREKEKKGDKRETRKYEKYRQDQKVGTDNFTTKTFNIK